MLPRILSSENSSNTFLKEMKNRKSLIKTFNSTFGYEYYSLGILKILNDMLTLCGPLLLNEMIHYINNSPTFIEKTFPSFSKYTGILYYCHKYITDIFIFMEVIHTYIYI